MSMTRALWNQIDVLTLLQGILSGLSRKLRNQLDERSEHLRNGSEGKVG